MEGIYLSWLEKAPLQGKVVEVSDLSQDSVVVLLLLAAVKEVSLLYKAVKQEAGTVG